MAFWYSAGLLAVFIRHKNCRAGKGQLAFFGRSYGFVFIVCCILKERIMLIDIPGFVCILAMTVILPVSNEKKTFAE